MRRSSREKLPFRCAPGSFCGRLLLNIQLYEEPVSNPAFLYGFNLEKINNIASFQTGADQFILRWMVLRRLVSLLVLVPIIFSLSDDC